MPVSRRGFLATLGAGGAGVLASPLIHARGREAAFGGVAPQGVEERKADRRMASRPGVIRIDSNENPVGPGERAIAAIQQTFGQANRYPVLLEDDLKDAIAKVHGIASDQVILGCGSGELLRSAVQAFTARDREYSLHTGDVLVIARGVVHEARSATGGVFLLTLLYLGPESAVSDSVHE